MVFPWGPGWRRSVPGEIGTLVLPGVAGASHLERCRSSGKKNSKAVWRFLFLSQDLKSSWEQAGDTGHVSDGLGGAGPVVRGRKLQPFVPTWECWLLAQLVRSSDLQDNPELQVVFLSSFFFFNDYSTL